MKKIFTLLAFVFMSQVTFADDVIASYTFPDQTITATATVSGTNCTVSYAKIGGNSDNQRILNEQYYFHKFTNATSAWVKITLSSGSFQAGDKFYATLYNGNTSTDGFYFKTASTGNSKTVTYSKTEETNLEYELKDNDINDDGSITVFRYSSNCYLRHIEVTRETGATKEPPTTYFTAKTVGFKLSAGTSAGQSVTTNSDGTVTYESSNTAVVNIDASTGALTANAVGKAKITAKTASSDTYAASTATYTVYVLSDGDGTLENPYLPTDYRYLSETYVPEYTEVEGAQVENKVMAWAVGYIVGAYASGDAEVRIGNMSAEGTVGLANTASETVGSNCLSCQLITDTEPRTDLNLKSHNENLSKKVYIYGRVGSFVTSSQTVYGLRHADNYSWDGVTVVPELTGVNNITVADANADGKIYSLSGMEVKTPAKGVYIQNGKKFVVK